MAVHALAQPLLRLLAPEAAHGLTLWGLAHGLGPGGSARARGADDPGLAVSLWGRDFPNPIGLAAGFDKNAQVPGPLLACGFGFVEVGTVTPLPQPGNPRPRIFRLPQDRAVINRLGFNNEGAEAARRRLADWRRANAKGIIGGGIVGVNLGMNKESADPAADYAAGVRLLGPLADYLVINVSSPNTPGLRALQDRAALESLIAGLRGALVELKQPPPLLLKVAPDLSEAELADIAQVALAERLDGLIATNTTVERPPGLTGRHRSETGGLSGRPLFQRATEVLGRLYRLTGGKVPLIGTGGIGSGAEAYQKIRAGASLVQLYTALVYRGPALVPEIKAELAGLLARDGFRSVAEATGADHR